MSDIDRPHDRFFRERMSHRETARDFLENYLPEEVRDHLDLETLRLEPGTFVDAGLREHRSDLLYRVRRADGGGCVFVYMVLEHKSRPDPLVSLQLLRYQTRIHARQARREGLPLSPIVPIVLYHGRTRWRVPETFGGLVKAPNPLRSGGLDFRYRLVDISRYSDEEIRGATLLRVTLLALRHVFDPDLRRRAPAILGLLRDVLDTRTGIDALRVVLQYLGEAAGRLGPSALRRVVSEAFPAEGERIMKTLHGEWIEKGRRRGLEQGLEQGRREGAISVAQRHVLEVLELRFGELPAFVGGTVRDVEDLSALEALLRRAVTANSLDDFHAELDRPAP